MALWAGNANTNGSVIYQGEGGDATVPFFDVLTDDNNLLGLPNYIAPGYFEGDVDMSCEVIYQGEGNDLWLMFYNVLSHPENQLGLINFIVPERLPEND